MSQPTDESQVYQDTQDTQRKMTKTEMRENWPHETPYGWDMVSSQGSDASRAPCSLDVPLTQVEEEQVEEKSPFSPLLGKRKILVPDTPPLSSQEEMLAAIERAAKKLRECGFTAYEHPMADGKIMQMAYKIYDTHGNADAW